VGVKVLEQAPAALKWLPSIQLISESLGQRNIYLFNVLQEDKVFLLQPPAILDEEKLSYSNIAVLNKGHTDILSELAGFCSFEAYSFAAEWDSISSGDTSIGKQNFLLADLLIYGSKEHLQEVGKILDHKKVFLQEPDYRNPNLDYINPHILDLSAVHPEPGCEVDRSSSPFLQLDTGSQDELSWQAATPQALLKDRIATAFRNTTRARSLKRIAADIRINTHLKPSVKPLLLRSNEVDDF
jgi:hypothetical protein